MSGTFIHRDSGGNLLDLRPMNVSDFSFELPPELIAQRPTDVRGDSRLLEFGGAIAPTDHQFRGLPSLLRPEDLIVFNDTQVLRARLHGVKADSGGKIELLVERLLDERTVLCQIRASKSPKAGTGLLLEQQVAAEVTGRDGNFFVVRFEQDVLPQLETHGHLPLPPYIERPDDVQDEQRYQTVFGEKPGAVAAPTAGLHFDDAMLERIDAMGVHTARVTLHVGAGTYQPVRVDKLEDHEMHSEWLQVDQAVCGAVAACRARGGRVIAVGTTVVRSLETAARAHGGELQPYAGESRLFLFPGEKFHVVDAMITNFHLSQSTLLMLVSAFAGLEETRTAYAHAIAQRYRFFSYGDACFVHPVELLAFNPQAST